MKREFITGEHKFPMTPRRALNFIRRVRKHFRHDNIANHNRDKDTYIVAVMSLRSHFLWDRNGSQIKAFWDWIED